MSHPSFFEMLERRIALGHFVCVGLDSDYDKIPQCARKNTIALTIEHPSVKDTLTFFNNCIIQATAHIVCAYKINAAFYRRHGAAGIEALTNTVQCIRQASSDVPVILDYKCADIGNTNKGYVEEAFDKLKVDAVTVHPYLGQEALQPFLEKKDKGIFVLCRTSNKGAGEFQDRIITLSPKERQDLMQGAARKFDCDECPQNMPLYQYVAWRVANHWNVNGNCGLVVGATYPYELEAVRKIVGDMNLLIPAIGAQQGDLEGSVKAGASPSRKGFFINSSRNVIFASPNKDFADAARQEVIRLNIEIHKILESV